MDRDLRRLHASDVLSGNPLMWSWLVIAVIAFVVLGPKEMPAAMRKLARYMGRFRRMSDEFKRQLMSMDMPEPSNERTDNDDADQ